MKPRGIVAELATLFLGVLAAAWLLGVPRDFVGSPDANEYAEFCNAILDGRLFTRQGDEVSRALATRTPGYPLALAALTAFGLGSRNVLSVLHAGVALLTLLSVPLLLRRFAPVGLCAAGVLVAFLGMKSYYERPVTEWLALNLLLMSFALVVRYCERPVAMRLVAVGLAVSACVLTRPALIPTVLVPLGLACLSPGRARIMLLVALASLTRDMAVVSSGASVPLANADLGEPIRQMAVAFGPDRLDAAYAAIAQARRFLDRNASPKIVADWLAVRL